MDETYGKNAAISPKAASLSKLAVDQVRDEDVNSRRATTCTLTTDTAVDPVPFDNSLELESRSPISGQNAQFSAHAVIVPRPHRRGLFARATILAEVKDPYQYSYKTKWFIVFLVAYAAAAAPMGSAIFFRVSYCLMDEAYPG